MPDRASLDCPCCGDVGAWGDNDGLFSDGDPLVCGCPGMVMLGPECNGEGEVVDIAYVSNFDEPCAQCDAALTWWVESHG